MQSILLVLLSSVLTALGQVAFKYGMQTMGDFEFSMATAPRLFWQIFTTPSIILGFFSFGLGAVVWLFALARLELSYAVPLASVTYIIVLAAGVMLFREPITAAKIAGTLLVAAGVVALSMK